MKKIAAIIGWIVLLAAFASLGFATDNKAVGVPLYALFFIVVFGGVFMYTKKHQKRQEANPEFLSKMYKIIGILLLIFALLTPSMVLKSAQFLFFVYIIITLINGILIALGTLAVTIINGSDSKRFLGYIILIVISVIPAVAIMQYDSSYSALGTAYYAALISAVFAWWGFSLFQKAK